LTLVAVLKETTPGEQRVAQVPETVKKLSGLGLRITVERGAGDAAHIADGDYERAGASIAPSVEVALADARIVLKVQPPNDAESRLLRPETVLVSFLQQKADSALLARLAALRVHALAMERVPRTTRAQSLDALSSQATVAGYKSVLLGASLCPRLLPMLTTAAGTLTPAKVLVLGAGVAGLQAVATAKRLGAVVAAFDVRPAVREQVQSLGARFVDVVGIGAGSETRGGYAAQLGEEQARRVCEAIDAELGDVDLVIATAQIPGKPAPRLITRRMLQHMKPGAVVVDVAAESGGNCELTCVGEAVREAGVTILGPTNLASSVPLHASMMYARNVSALLRIFVERGETRLDPKDDIIAAMLVTSNGAICP